MTLRVESEWDYYDYHPLTESVGEEFWSRVGDRVLWVGDVERAGKRAGSYLPSAAEPAVQLSDGIYERIVAVDIAVIPVLAHVQSVMAGSVYLPFVAVRAAVGTWVCAVSWLAMEGVEECVKAFGRPPWGEPVEIQSVWGRGIGHAQCVSIRPGLRGRVKGGK